MTADSLKKFFGYLRTVQISESLKVDTCDTVTYLKTSELPRRITEAEAYVTGLVSENQILSSKVAQQKMIIEDLKSERRVWESERSLLLDRISELS